MHIKRPLCLVCLLFAAATAACLLLFPQSSLPKAVRGGERAALSGQVYRYRQYEERTVLWLKNLKAAPDAASGTFLSGVSQKDKCICYCEKTEEVRIGSIVSVEGGLDTFSRARNPGEFDYARYYQSQDIAFCLRRARILGAREDAAPHKRVWASLRNLLERIRQGAAGLLADYLSGEDAGILSAMLLGDQSMLDDEVRSLYKRSGISHILAISGLHISMLGMMIYRLLIKIRLPRGAAMGLAAAMIGLYGLMTGMSPSTRRAMIMFVIGLNAERVGRAYDMRTALFVTMTLLLLGGPAVMESAAFQMSFGAVLGIALIEPALSCLCTVISGREKGRLPKLLRSFLCSLSVSLATLPVILARQYEYAVYGIFLNLLVLPGMAALIPAGMLIPLFGAGARMTVTGRFGTAAGMVAPGMARKAAGALCRLFDACAGLAAFFCHGILSMYARGSRFVSSLPGNRIVGRPDTVRLWIYGGMTLAFALTIPPLAGRVGKKGEGGRAEKTGAGKVCKNGRMVLFFGSVLYLALALLLLLVPVRRGLTVTMLDVGQGDGICIERRAGHAILIDCGSSDQAALLENRLLPFLKYKGICELDAVFLSHLDQDHCSAVLGLLGAADSEGITVRQLVISGRIPRDQAYEKLLQAARAASVPVRFMYAGDRYEQGELRLTCLAPDGETAAGGDRNACSMVLKLDYGDFQGLFMGDTDAEGEMAALDAMDIYAPDGTIELLKVAHHGSASSSTEMFLEAAEPEVAVISCGVDNWYGHPAGEVLERLAQCGCDVYRTDEGGAVSVHVGNGKMVVEEYLTHPVFYE